MQLLFGDDVLVLLTIFKCLPNYNWYHQVRLVCKKWDCICTSNSLQRLFVHNGKIVPQLASHKHYIHHVRHLRFLGATTNEMMLQYLTSLHLQLESLRIIISDKTMDNLPMVPFPMLNNLLLNSIHEKFVTWIVQCMPQLHRLELFGGGDLSKYLAAQKMFALVKEIHLSAGTLSTQDMAIWLASDTSIAPKLKRVHLDVRDDIVVVLAQCINLSELVLNRSNNATQELVDALAKQLTMMKYLKSVRLCDMPGVVASSICEALPVQLTVLEVFPSDFDMHSILHLANLQTLLIGECKLIKFCDMSQLTKLQSLTIKVPKSRNASYLVFPSNVKSITLEELVIPASSFANVKQLKSLNMGRCSISNLDDAMQIAIGKTLTSLHIDKSKTVDWNLELLPKLNVLEISCIEQFTNTLPIAQLHQLYKLCLENLNLDQFPEHVLDIASLIHLSLANNNVATIPASLCTNTCAAKLEHLDVSNNTNFTCAPDFSQYPSLKQLKWTICNDKIIAPFHALEHYNNHSMESISHKFMSFYKQHYKYDDKCGYFMCIHCIIPLAHCYYVLSQLQVSRSSAMGINGDRQASMTYAWIAFDSNMEPMTLLDMTVTKPKPFIASWKVACKTYRVVSQ